jgi:23S rRNA (cytosine1962-C5)-methyltransferase
MGLLRNSGRSPVKLRLQRDLIRIIKRGHVWVYAEALYDLPPAQAGSPAILYDKSGKREICRGFYNPQHPIALRVCSTERGEEVNEEWAQGRMQNALKVRKMLFDQQTTGYRLFNGEGDGLPGLVCDVYGKHAVILSDGDTPYGFYNVDGVGQWVSQALGLQSVYLGGRGQFNPGALVGKVPEGPVPFLENGMRFLVDLVHGQKTGFFLDQRANRVLARQLSNGKTVLNMFGYTGGFSVATGLGGARKVVTVDTAKMALQMAGANWELNGLPKGVHRKVEQDAFAYLDEARKHDQTWDLVILDPPSFAPSAQALPQALEAYRSLTALGAGVTTDKGILACASCSSHVSMETFLKEIEEGISRARRRATLLGIFGQPLDHPAPLVMPELRYLKMVWMVLF